MKYKDYNVNIYEPIDKRCSETINYQMKIMIEAKTIFSENIALCNLHWKEVECEVVSKEE